MRGKRDELVVRVRFVRRPLGQARAVEQGGQVIQDDLPARGYGRVGRVVARRGDENARERAIRSEQRDALSAGDGGWEAPAKHLRVHIRAQSERRHLSAAHGVAQPHAVLRPRAMLGKDHQPLSARHEQTQRVCVWQQPRADGECAVQRRFEWQRRDEQVRKGGDLRHRISRLHLT